MLTIFALPKPFKGHIGRIQKNALTTWSRLQPKCEVILLGDEEGIEEAAKEAGAEWIPAIKRNDYGTPLLSDAFHQAATRARSGLLCYVNADIMLTDELVAAAQALSFPDFLATGRRCNLDHPEPLDCEDDNWTYLLKQRTRDSGTMDHHRALDYFVFRRESPLRNLPNFPVGRPGWDNWMIYNARRRNLPVVDLSEAVTVVHQLHDYRHVPQQRGSTWHGPEADHNLKLVQSPDTLRFSLHDATHKLLPGGRLTKCPQSLGMRVRHQIAFHPSLRWPLEIAGFPFLFRERLRRSKMKKADSQMRPFQEP